MKYEDPHDPEPAPQLLREWRLRLFQQLHQSPDSEDLEPAGLWRRANGYIRCRLCWLPYREHPVSEESVDWNGEAFDNRLCNGEVVHL
ncbi:MAG: hypothetical protein RIQ41_477 [Candidatus Parcubacteria bacterium]|jgi:hypothetical protein